MTDTLYDKISDEYFGLTEANVRPVKLRMTGGAVMTAMLESAFDINAPTVVEPRSFMGHPIEIAEGLPNGWEWVVEH